uniref:Uncharacterized protein n=1 Tax=uncultured marine proteobacterium TaxID=482892 RepID=Q8RTT0_9PROT|nr:hypothetical protein MBMO_EBAC000-65D09.53 [uncultured marine proteobacterium]
MCYKGLYITSTWPLQRGNALEDLHTKGAVNNLLKGV